MKLQRKYKEFPDLPRKSTERNHKTYKRSAQHPQNHRNEKRSTATDQKLGQPENQ